MNNFNLECMPGVKFAAANAVLSAIALETDSERKAALMDALRAIDSCEHFYDEE